MADAEPHTLKACARCQRVLPLDEFPLRRKGEDRRYGHCRSCKAAYQRQWYERNRERHIANVRIVKQTLRALHLDIVVKAKSRPKV